MLFRATYSRCCGLNGQNGCDNSKWTRWIGDLYSYCSAYMNFFVFVNTDSVFPQEITMQEGSGK